MIDELGKIGNGGHVGVCKYLRVDIRAFRIKIELS